MWKLFGRSLIGMWLENDIENIAPRLPRWLKAKWPTGEKYSKVKTKSGIMLGLGEHEQEVYETMDDLRIMPIDMC
jgi:lipoate synthase